MGMMRAAPWWLTWLLVAGLVSLFIGERVLEAFGPARVVFSGVGALIVLGTLIWRALSFRTSAGDARRVERLLWFAYLGCALAVAMYFVSSEDGIRLLGIYYADDVARQSYRMIMLVLWTTLLAVSAFTAVGAQLALAAHRHAGIGAAGVEAYRVRDTAAAGLTVALAGALLLFLGFSVSRRDRSLDLSYFRTSVPGESTQGMVASLDDPLRVLLFYPPVNPVKDELLRYFRALSEATGNVAIEEHDRLVDPEVAEQYTVTQDGTIILARGEDSERMIIDPDLDRARSLLRGLDSDFQQALMPLLRDRRSVYMTTGHGEINDPQSRGPFAGTPMGQVEALKEMLRVLNYGTENLSVAGGLASGIPSDAAMIMVLGPTRPFLDAEMAALDRYLADGGSLLLALDPEGDFDAAPLEQRLGIRYAKVPLADDEQYVLQRGDESDRRLLVTDRFSSHETTTSINRAGVGAGLVVPRPGHLQSVEGATVTSVPLVRSLPSTFADVDPNLVFDPATEVRNTYDLITAIQGPSGAAGAAAETAPTGTAERGMRALVFSSSLMFSDAVLVSLGLNAALIADGVRWLGGEDAFVGPTETEEDVPVVHTRAENVAWFYATILGAPALVLGLGLAGVVRHRKRERSV
jgi:hypothetical protein